MACHTQPRVISVTTQFSSRVSYLILFSTLALSSAKYSLAMPFGRFVDLKPIPGLDSPGSDTGGIFVSQDGLTAYFGRVTGNPVLGPEASDLFVSTRESVNDAFGAPVILDSSINLAGALNESPHVTADGLRLYWSSPTVVSEPITLTNIYMAERNTTAEPFTNRVRIAELDTDDDWEYSPSLSADELTVVFDKGAFDKEFNITRRDLFMASRASISDPFDPPQPIDALNTSAAEAHPSLSSDGLTLFFSRYVGIPDDSPEIWVASRGSIEDSFSNPMSLEDMFNGSIVNAPNTATWEPFISSDWPAPGSKLYFTRTTTENTQDWDFYQATWIPEPSACALAIAAIVGVLSRTTRNTFYATQMEIR